MRVLWFTNTPVLTRDTDATSELRASGGWMHALLAELQGRHDVQLGIVSTARTRRPAHYQTGNVDCFLIPDPERERHCSELRTLNHCAAIVGQWKPDLLHIHGTEKCHGLLTARNLVDAPTVISLQGLMGPYSEWRHYFGQASLIDVLKMHRVIEPFLLRGQLWMWRQYRTAARREQEIIRENHHFMGRTTWDRDFVMTLNPGASYYPAGELLRKAFEHHRWELAKCRRHRIIFTNAGHPRKGTDILLEAVRMLQPQYPDLQACVAGDISRRSGYGRHIRRRIAETRGTLELGALNAEEMGRELTDAHVFVSPSLIDNSPNAVCEAQRVGMPVVAARTGGVPSLVDDGQTGLLFRSGSPSELATCLERVFEDDALATELGERASTCATERHDPERVVNQVMSAYAATLAQP